MTVRRNQNLIGEIQAKRLKVEVINKVWEKTGAYPNENQSLDQLVRTAAKHGIVLEFKL